MSQHRPLSFLAITFALAGCPADDGGSEESGADDDDSGSDTGTSMTNASMTADDDSATGPDSSGPDSTGGDPVDPLTCPGAGMGAGAAGDACTANADCESGICTLFTDAPVNEDAACGEPITTNEAGYNTAIER